MPIQFLNFSLTCTNSVVGPIIVLHDLAEANNAILNSTTLYSCPPVPHKSIFVFWQIKSKEKEIRIYRDLCVPSVPVQVPQPSCEMGIVFLPAQFRNQSSRGSPRSQLVVRPGCESGTDLGGSTQVLFCTVPWHIVLILLNGAQGAR